jgi:chromosome segregation ATPase
LLCFFFFFIGLTNSLFLYVYSAANITIHLTNGGPQPYKPELFPGHIIIERRLNKEGPSPYKLKNASGRVVSQKKEDLVAVLDHFAILINNPLTMLTQDMARKFLSDSTPEDKYKLFMHGTQLTQLRSDFETVRESIDTATVTLERKRESLPKLEVEAREAQRRFLDYQKVSEIEEELDNLSSELVWSQIITKEKEAERTKVEVDMAKRKMEEMEAVYEGHREQIEQVNKKIEKVNDEWDVFKSVPDPNAEEKAELTQKKIAKEIEQSDTKVN